jgi:hypothetical protein
VKSVRKLPVAPFLHFVKSVPVWALGITFTSSAWGFYTLLTEIPTYLNNIQHVPLTAVSNMFRHVLRLQFLNLCLCLEWIFVSIAIFIMLALFHPSWLGGRLVNQVWKVISCKDKENYDKHWHAYSCCGSHSFDLYRL